nr:phosphoadenosine phosphosulfate reductase family protein [uncultured Arsenicibacter sp.]
MIDVHSYDLYIVAFSGGKDSVACLLNLLDLGIPKHKIELWHHDIDGHDTILMDWECTPDYCRKLAGAFGLPIYYSWKEGGFRREMLRRNSLTAPNTFETPSGNRTAGGKTGKPGTRLKFPQVSPDLSVRWCSGYLKIDICKTAIRNQERFNGIRTLVISGERGEESPNRAKYAQFEPDEADLRNGRTPRHVDRWRPVLHWKEQEIWEIIERHKVQPHPAYYLGWSRVSCKFCIFGNANQFASAYKISPRQGDELITLEQQFGCTLKREQSLPALIAKGKPYPETDDTELVKVATSTEYTLPIITENWQLPAGAYGESCGPI